MTPPAENVAGEEGREEEAAIGDVGREARFEGTGERGGDIVPFLPGMDGEGRRVLTRAREGGVSLVDKAVNAEPPESEPRRERGVPTGVASLASAGRDGRTVAGKAGLPRSLAGLAVAAE